MFQSTFLQAAGSGSTGRDQAVRASGLKTARERRKAAGRWLRELRERAGLSHRDLADRVGMRFPALIAALEDGRGRIPPGRYDRWAAALGVPLAEFARRMDACIIGPR